MGCLSSRLMPSGTACSSLVAIGMDEDPLLRLTPVASSLRLLCCHLSAYLLCGQSRCLVYKTTPFPAYLPLLSSARRRKLDGPDRVSIRLTKFPALHMLIASRTSCQELRSGSMATAVWRDRWPTGLPFAFCASALDDFGRLKTWHGECSGWYNSHRACMKLML